MRSYGSLEDRERSGREFVLFELRNLELGEVAAWLCQQFLDLCVRHDVAVLDVGTTVLAASRSLSLKEIAMRPKETSVINYGKEPKLKISRG